MVQEVFDNTTNSTAIKGFGAGTADRVTNTDAILILRPRPTKPIFAAWPLTTLPAPASKDATTITTAVTTEFLR